ncbi:LysR family transcriptional regulator [Teichococcus vastitatis]|uniref:LysR family transcriptional regulator n=1 Tax=Teichococcus vastitatis TaxID=2307076 RepID=A0ABS9W8T0_9PROT|nr:LysR family transcriptional regulator [Pseudoroseomonas vastitatis]MCI0755691.1 LysR family transcriptional regulator [Pseudoroseomonas vastitatis]
MLSANLNDIAVFMAVVEAGSFAAGGKATGLTRSAAGKAVSRLEDRLGVRLLNRTTRALSLTDEGRSFQEHGLGILAAVEAAEASVASPAGTPRGVLRLTAPQAYGRRVILPLMERYLTQWPHTQIEASFTDRPIDIVEEGFDLAIRFGGTAAGTRLVSRVVARARYSVVASPAYISRHGRPGSLADLSGHQGLAFSSRGNRQSWRYRDAKGAWMTASFRSRLRLDSGEALRDAAVRGLGIGLLPDFLVADDIRSGDLLRLLPDCETEVAEIVVLYPTRRLVEPRVRQFIDLLVSALKH